MGRSGGGCTRSPCLNGNFNKSYSRVHSITIFTFPSRAVSIASALCAMVITHQSVTASSQHTTTSPLRNAKDSQPASPPLRLPAGEETERKKSHNQISMMTYRCTVRTSTLSYPTPPLATSRIPPPFHNPPEYLPPSPFHKGAQIVATPNVSIAYPPPAISGSGYPAAAAIRESTVQSVQGYTVEVDRTGQGSSGLNPGMCGSPAQRGREGSVCMHFTSTYSTYTEGKKARAGE